MKSKWNSGTVIIAALAGFLGGMAPHALFSSNTVHAQAFVQNGRPLPPLQRPGKQQAPGVVAAQRFLLVDSAGNVFGVIGMNHDRPEIDLYDSNGNVVWRAPAHFGVTPTSE